MIRKLLTVAVLAASVLTTNVALAHEAKPKHGGVLQAAVDDVTYELVHKGDVATIFVEDHGKPVATAGIKGKLTVLNGTEKSESELKPAGDNRLEAPGMKLGKGAKAIASVSASNDKTTTVRFALK